MTVTSSDQHDRGSCGQVEKPVSVRLDHVQRRFVEIPIGGYAFMKGNNEGDQSTRHTEEITYVPASQPRRRNTWAPDESRLLFDKKVGPRGSDMVDRGTEVETMQVQNVGVSCHGEGCIMDACHGIETCSVSASWPHSVKMVQQILFQNIDAEAFHDWLEWEDPVDDYRPTKGTFLPLWTVHCGDGEDDGMHMGVMALEWNPVDNQAFAVGLGPCDVQRTTIGRVLIYSLHDMKFPEHSIEVPYGVMALAFNSMCSCGQEQLAVGCQDGSLHIVTASDSPSMHIYTSSKTMESHIGPIIKILWDPNEQQTLYTFSTDGTVGSWKVCHDGTLHRSKSSTIGSTRIFSSVRWEDVLKSVDNVEPTIAIDMAQLHDQGWVAVCGTFHGTATIHGSYNVSNLLTGAETNNSSHPKITKIQAHASPITAVAWNPIDSDYFFTASIDWSVNIWDREGNQRVSLDMGSPVIDAAWSPTSSTIISCITEDRCLCTYDISISKDRPICRQKICNKDILTTLLIHPTKPIILVGTSGSRILCMKLSPNLRCRKPQVEEGMDDAFFDDIASDDLASERKTSTREPLPLEQQLQFLQTFLQSPF